MAWQFTNDRPIYSQLVDKIKFDIISRNYLPGVKLLSVRDMASEACVNPNTMQRALTELEDMGLVYSVRTSGRFVTDDVDKIDKFRTDMAQEVVLNFIGHMTKLGFRKTQISDIISQKLNNI